MRCATPNRVKCLRVGAEWSLVTSDIDRAEAADNADDFVDLPEDAGYDAAGGLNLTPDSVEGPSRGPWLGICAAVIAIALGVGGFMWWRAQDAKPAPTPPAATAPQHSLFIAVSSPDNQLVNGLYYATGDQPTGLFTPGTLLADVPTLGKAPLSAALPVGADVPGTVFSDVTGLKVEQSWVLPMDAMAGLIDKAGGVTVDVDVPVSANGVDLKPGEKQLLNGLQAMTFATWTATGETQSAQVARMSQVATTLVAELPTDQGEVEKLLAEVPGSTTGTPAELAEQLVELQGAVHSEDYLGSLLPVTAAATPDVPAGVVVDRARLATLLDGRVDDLRLFTPGSAGSVVMQNASGVESAEIGARRKLIDQGYDFSFTGLAEPVQATTIVMVPSNVQVDDGKAIAKDLGVPDAQVLPSPLVPSGADALILLGADFTPDPQPEPSAGE